MSPDQLHILQHSLGCDKHGQPPQGHRMRDELDGCFGYHRNRYVSDPTPDLVALVAAGLLLDRGAWNLAGGMHYYSVSELGLAAMKQHSPKPPKVSRGRRHYLDFLNADSGMSFGEYLKWRHANRHRLAELGYTP